MVTDLERPDTRPRLTLAQAEQIHRAVDLALRERRVYTLDGEQPEGSRRAVSVLRFLLDNVEALTGAEMEAILDMEPGDGYPFMGGAGPLITLRRMV